MGDCMTGAAVKDMTEDPLYPGTSKFLGF